MARKSKTGIIPKKLHFIFLSKTEPLPESFSFFVGVAGNMHPDWEICTYNEDDARAILEQHFPELIPLYYAYPVNVQRADMLRVLLVYLYGGFYLDMDIYCLKKLNPLLKFGAVLAEEKVISAAEQHSLGLKHRQRIANYMFGSKPGHPFWLQLINAFIDKASKKVANENDVLETTGPGMLTDLYHSVKYRHTDMVLLTNHDRKCLNEGHAVTGCHFGNYAAHLHTGTWRWQNRAATPQHEIADAPRQVLQDTSIAKYKPPKHRPHIYVNGDPGNDVFTRELHNMLSPIARSRAGRKGRDQVIHLHLNLDAARLGQVDPNDINIFIGDSCDLSPVRVNTINRYFRYCVTFSDIMRRAFLSAGILVPVQVISPAFTRPLREFYHEVENPYFTIGCFAGSHTQDSLHALISTLNALTQDEIANVKLKIYDPDSKFLALRSNKDPRVDLTFGQLSANGLSKWYKDIAVMAFGTTDSAYSMPAMQAIYTGVPVIIPNTDHYHIIRRKVKSKAIVVYEPNAPMAITRAITEIYRRYSYFNKKALMAAHRVEDICSPDEFRYDLLQLLNSL